MLGHLEHVLSYSRRNNSRAKSSLRRINTNQLNLETEDGLKEYNERLETRMNEVIDLTNRCQLNIDLEELRRNMIYEDEINGEIFGIMTQNSFR